MTLRHKTLDLFLITLIALVLTSCSSFFSAGMTGKVTVKDKSGNTGIPGVLVCAYTSEAERNRAYDNYKYSYDNEFLGTTATFRTYTDDNGNFSIKSIKWNTSKPQYGKDGDNITIYPLYFHKDYGLGDSKGLIKGSPFTITSDSINEGANQTLERIRDEYTITIAAMHPTKGTDYSSEYSCKVIEKINTPYIKDPEVRITQVENTNRFKINYTKDCDMPQLAITNIEYTNQEEIQRTSKPCKKDTDLNFFTEEDFTNPIPIFFNPNVGTYYFYAKQIRFSYPATIRGRLTSADPDESFDVTSNTYRYGKDGDNGLTVYVEDKDGKQLGRKVNTTQTIQGDKTLIIKNGNFTINITNETYVNDRYKGEEPKDDDVMKIKICYPLIDSSIQKVERSVEEPTDALLLKR